MLPRGLRPLATEETCRTNKVVTLLLAFAAILTFPGTRMVVPFVSSRWSFLVVSAVLAVGHTKGSHSWQLGDVLTIECQEMASKRR